MQRKGGVLLSGEFGQMGANEYTASRQQLLGYSPRQTQGGCQASGEMSAAAHVGVSAPLQESRVIGVSGAWLVMEFLIILRADIGIFDDGTQRRTTGLAVFHSREKDRKIRFPALGGKTVFTGSPSFHESDQGLHVNRFSGGKMVDDDPDGLAVRLAKQVDFERFSEFR